MEHLTNAAKEFIPWFGQTNNGYLYMLTKSSNIDQILDLSHNSHTFITWSMNNEFISKKFELGAPSFQHRLEAAHKVQKAGYPVRLRLDPILPFPGWKDAYAQTIKDIFARISPERITIGTLRFEEGLYNMKNKLLKPELSPYLDEMVPMFPPKLFPGAKKPKTGKYSFTRASAPL